MIKRTHTYANAAGDLRIDEQGFSSTSTVSSSADSTVTTTFEPGRINDTTIFQSKGKAIVSLEGDTCRRMTADSKPPPGLGAEGANLGDFNKQMADAMKQASSAIEQAMKQARNEGMTREQEAAMKQFTQPFTDPNTIKPDDTLHLEKLNKSIRVGKYSGRGYLVAEEDGTEKYRIWVASDKSIDGAPQIRRAMLAMIDVYAEYMERMGGGALMDTGLTSMFAKDELDGTYPIRIEDLEDGEITDIVEIESASASVDYYPDCVVKEMFGQ